VPSTCQPGFTDTTRAGDHQVTFVAYPFTGQQLLEKGFVQSPARPVIHILRGCSHMAQFGGAHAALKTLGVTAGRLSVDQQAQPFSVAKTTRSVLCFQFAEGFRHSVKL
jgi:hypothetical protein